jgi:hypothetical protein
MPLNQHYNDGLGNSEGGVEGFEELAGSIREKLKPGGPPVDFGGIHLYISGDLNEEDARRVRENIVLWQTWNHAYWDTIAALG